MYSILGTKKLLDRVKRPVLPPVAEPTPALGNWYATAVFWQPQVALLVNERTLFPLLMPLAPAATLIERFPASLEEILEAGKVPSEFAQAQVAAMSQGTYARTASRSVVGSMNEFVHLAKSYREHRGISDLTVISLILSQTPCGPLYRSHISPDRELDALVSRWLAERRDQTS